MNGKTYPDLIAIRPRDHPARSRHDRETSDQFGIGRLFEHDPSGTHLSESQVRVAPDYQVVLTSILSA